LHAIFLHAHNDYLEFLSDLGISGLLLLGGGLILLARGVFIIWAGRRDKCATYVTLGAAIGVFAILLHGVVDFNMHIPSNALLFFILLGICFAMVSSRPREERNTDYDMSTLQARGLGILWLVSLAIAVLATAPLSETYSVYASDKLYRKAMSTRYTPSEKISILKDAIAKDQDNAVYSYELGQLDRVNALDALRTAISLNPTNERYWFALGLERMRQWSPQADDALSTAVYLEPSLSTYRLAYGWHLLGWKKDLAGIAQAKSALALDLDHRNMEKILEITWQIIPSYTQMRRLLPKDTDSALRGELERFLRQKEADFGEKG